MKSLPTRTRARNNRLLDRVLSSDEREARWAVLGIAFFFAALQVVVILLTPLGLAGDEAHYWEWSKRLDWAYFSKGPIVALLIRGGTAIFGDTTLGIRFPAVLCLFLFSFVFYRLARRVLTSGQSVLALLIVRLAPIFSSMGLFMTTDAPVALFWAASLLFVLEALDGKRGWTSAFAMAGLATLTKYTAALLVPLYVVAFLLFRPRQVRSFLAGIALYALFLVPVVLWNSRHGWINFEHNAGHLAGGKRFSIRYLGELIGGQLGLFGPIAFVLFALALCGIVRNYRETLRSRDRLIFGGSSLPIMLLCIAVSLTRRVYANWPMPAYIAGQVLLIPYATKRMLCWCVGANAVLSAVAYLLMTGVTLPGYAQFFPTKKLVGWSEIGDAVRQRRSGEFIFAEGYDLTSALAFYAKAPGESYCLPEPERRMNQYDVWGGLEKLAGRDAILVVKNVQALEEVRGKFQRILTLEEVPIHFGSDLLRTYKIYRGEAYLGTSGSGNSPFVR